MTFPYIFLASNSPEFKGKWLTVLKAQWTLNPDVYPHFTVSGTVESYSTTFELHPDCEHGTRARHIYV